MIPRISLAAAFVLMMAPPMARALTRDAASGAPITCGAQVTPPGTVLAQDEQSSPSMGTSNNDSDDDNSSDSDNDNDSNDNDNQNANGNQSDQNASGDDQQIPPTVLGSPDNDQSQSQQAPQPVNPYQ